MEKSRERHRVLVVDDDRDVAELVGEVLGEEGYDVTVLDAITPERVREAVGRIEPDCILLDGADRVEYGASWIMAGILRKRRRPIPTLMFTAHSEDAAEAVDASTPRATAAGFTGVLVKPFSVDGLLGAVDRAVGRATPFNHSASGELRRTQQMRQRLRAAGASKIHMSTRRESANFRSPSGDALHLYWSQPAGSYLLARYRPDLGRLEPLGRFYELDQAIRAATAPPGARPPDSGAAGERAADGSLTHN